MDNKILEILLDMQKEIKDMKSEMKDMKSEMKDINTKIIVLSAYTKTQYLLEAVELGLEKYLVKPINSVGITLP